MAGIYSGRVASYETDPQVNGLTRGPPAGMPRNSRL